MLEIAREKCQAYPNVTFCAASSSALPFPDHSFDMVVSASALHYFDQPEESLREMRREPDRARSGCDPALSRSLDQI